jgi:hypothetical protein
LARDRNSPEFRTHLTSLEILDGES